MNKFAFVSLCALQLCAASAAQAQAPGSLGGGPPVDPAVARTRAEFTLSQPGLRDLNVTGDVFALQRVSEAPAAAKTRANTLLEEASALSTQGKSAGFRSRVAEAATLLLGRNWTGDVAYAYSLALDVTELVADPEAPLHVRLTQAYSATTNPDLRLRLSLVSASVGRGPGPQAPERELKTYWTMPLDGGDLIAHNLPFDVDLSGLDNGSYALKGELLRGDAVLGVTRTPFRVVTGLLSAEREMRAGVARVKLREELATTILYPFDTARAVNGWRRDLPDNLDFAAAIARSRELLVAAEAGRDPLWQTTGDQRRAYNFVLGGESMPYHLYVPTTWKPGVKLPIVLMLHGGGGNEDGVFPAAGRFAGNTQKLAEQYQMIVVAPLGYRPSGGYGAVYGLTSAGREGVRASVAADQTIPSLSDADTMNVLARVAKEYDIDTKRIYVMGNSMGGGGAWFLAAKYPEMFAATSPNASSLPFDNYDFTKLSKMPVRIVVGALDVPLRQQLAHQAADTLAKLKYNATLTVVPNEDHPNAWMSVLTDTFAFLAAQHRR